MRGSGCSSSQGQGIDQVTHLPTWLRSRSCHPCHVVSIHPLPLPSSIRRRQNNNPPRQQTTHFHIVCWLLSRLPLSCPDTTPTSNSAHSCSPYPLQRHQPAASAGQHPHSTQQPRIPHSAQPSLRPYLSRPRAGCRVHRSQAWLVVRTSRRPIHLRRSGSTNAKSNSALPVRPFGPQTARTCIPDWSPSPTLSQDPLRSPLNAGQPVSPSNYCLLN